MTRVSTRSLLGIPLALCLGIAGAFVAPTSRAQSDGMPGSWSIKAPMPIKLVEVAVAAVNGKVYVLGGSATGRVFQSLNQEYDPATDRWRQRAPLPRAIDHAGATGLNGKIYVVGGFTAAGHSAPTNAMFEFDPASDAWRALAPLKSPRGSVGVTVLGGKIHAIGGRGPDKVTVGTHEVYDPASGTWSDLAPLPTARDHLVVVAANGRIHAIGGRLDSSAQNVDRHDVYTPATNAWESGAPMPTARSAVAGALHQHVIVVAGGECGHGRTYSATEAYDLRVGRWSTLASLPAGRHGFGAVAVGQRSILPPARWTVVARAGCRTSCWSSPCLEGAQHQARPDEALAKDNPGRKRRGSPAWFVPQSLTDARTRKEVVMTAIPTWHIAGDWFDNCSCAVACPCTFAQAPDNGFCESVLFWHVQRGHYGDVNLDGLSFVRVGRWEGDLWAGRVKGAAGLFIDERADERQAEALPLIFGGRAGGFPAQVAALFTEGRQVRGVERARIAFEIAPDRAHWGAEIAGKVKAWAKALTGPTSLPGKYPQLMNAPGCETGPGPQLVTWGQSTICSVDAFGYKFQWTTNSSKHIPFDWTGP